MKKQKMPLSFLLKKEQETVAVYFVSASAEFYLENYKEAKQQLNQAVKYDSTFHEAYWPS